jgi:hypothetical protein
VCVQIDEFAKTVLPKYFKHSNYASFKRQLHKVRIYDISDSCSFVCKMFRCSSIHRVLFLINSVRFP